MSKMLEEVKVNKGILDKFINDKDVLEYDLENLHALIYDFVTKNNLESTYLEFLKKEKEEVEKGNQYSRIDYDFEMKDYITES